MKDFSGLLLSSNYGLKPQGKSSPMSSHNSSNFDHQDSIFPPNLKNPDDFFNDFGVFSSGSNSKSFNFDSIFGGGGGGVGVGVGVGVGGGGGSRFSTLPVFDKPVYDDDDDVSSSAKYEDVFDDLLGGLGKKETRSGRADGPGSKEGEKGISNFDDLLQGFGSGGGTSINRTSSDATKKTSRVIGNPFVVLESASPHAPSSSGIFSDPLDEISSHNNFSRKHVENPTRGRVFDDLHHLDGLGKSVPAFSAEMNVREKDGSPLTTESKVSGKQTSAGGNPHQKYSVRSTVRGMEKKIAKEDYIGSPESVFDMPSVSVESRRSVPNAYSPRYGSVGFRESSSHGPFSPVTDENADSYDDVWLTVADFSLFTQPTAVPPPSRAPPPIPAQFSRTESGSFPASNAQKKASEYSSVGGSASYFQSPKQVPPAGKGSFESPIDELEDFAKGRKQSNVDGSSDVPFGDDFDANTDDAASAAAMKEAMDTAEARFRHAKGVRENAKVYTTRESAQVEREEQPAHDAQERELREHQERLEREQRQREREEEEENRRQEEEERRRIEKKRVEKERENRRKEREREFARQAVDRASREARDRAAIEARVRAERAVVQKAQSEARDRAGRAAVQRVQAEARERAAAESKEKARSEAREKEASERAAAAARANQQKNDNDLESFFGMGSHASSAPRPKASSSNPFETQFPSKPNAEAARSSVNTSSSMRNASSSTNIVDDLSSIFGGPPSAQEFQGVEGESEERRKARLERHQRTQERAAKALAEKNARDLEAQREQSERHRIAETLDAEIKRWAAGKESNLRALLSTLQHVLWPECGWQPVSLTDLITGASVKKVYRKATLCIHPDKVQQKGANLQQKYVAEKVFDLLKEAWNKFNSEELF